MTYDEARAAWSRRFDLPLDLLLPVWIAHVEGYIADDPDDPGGLTVYGLASATHPWVTRETTWEEAWARGYGPEYVEPLRVMELPAAHGFMLFELAVQHGGGAKMYQKALGVTPDGIIGPATVATAWERYGLGTIIEAHAERVRYVAGLSTWGAFGRGWMLRYIDALEIAIALSGVTDE